MEHWARGPLGRSADFLCICVDSLETAQTFHRLFQFRGCVNGWVPNPQSMPSYGQLGCSGFIVLDGKGGCVSKKTLPFLQHGEAAFTSLEALLARLVPAAPSAASAAAATANGYAPGSVLLLEKLKSDPSLNGARVRVLGFDTATGRFNVALEADAERVLAVKPCSLAPALPPQLQPQQVEAGEVPALRSISTPAATGCRSIDQEHAECTAALNALLAAPTSTAALAAAVAALAAHFEHEEAVLQQHRFGGSALGEGSEGGSSSGSSFSAAKGHAEDHARILALGREELERVAGVAATAGSAAASACKESVSWRLASAFSAHARDFDALFEGKLPEEA